MKREKRLIRLDVIIAVVLMLISTIALCENVYAASDVKLSISGGTVEQGKDITVTATISSDVEIWGFDAYIVYDSTNLEFKSGSIAGDAGDVSGGNGRIRLYSDICQSKSITVTLVFNAKQPGEHSVAFASAAECVFFDENVESLNINATAGKVKVNAPAKFSSDNTLSIIYAYSVYENGSTKPAWYWPDFTSDRTSYDLVVEGDVTKLNITATPNHNKATVVVSGNTLKVGSNKVVVTVTAEDGSKKEYVINVTKNEKVTEPPTTQPPTTTPSQTTTQKPEEPTTTAPKEDIKVSIGTKEYIILDYTDEMTIPEGYELYETTYKGENVVALKGLGTEIVIMALSEDGNTIIDFIYDETTEEFNKFNLINVLASQYVVLEMLSDLGEVELPNGYSLKSVNVNGKVVDAYANDVNALYIVYAMNWNGEKALYYYDSVNNTMMKYFTVTNGDIGFTEEKETTTNNGTTTENNGTSGNVQVDGQPTDETNSEEFERLKEKMQIIIIGGIVIIVLLIGIIIVMAASKNKNNDDDDDEYEDESEEDDEEEVEETEETNETDDDTEEVEDAEEVEENEEYKEDTKNEEKESFGEKEKSFAQAEATFAKTESTEKAEEFEEESRKEAEKAYEELKKNIVQDSAIFSEAKESTINSNKDSEGSNKIQALLKDDTKSLQSEELDMVLDDLLDGLSE